TFGQRLLEALHLALRVDSCLHVGVGLLGVGGIVAGGRLLAGRVYSRICAEVYAVADDTVLEAAIILVHATAKRRRGAPVKDRIAADLVALDVAQIDGIVQWQIQRQGVK